MPPASYGQPPLNGPGHVQPSSSQPQFTAPFMPGPQPMGGSMMKPAMTGPSGQTTGTVRA